MPEITSISDNKTLVKGDSVSLNCTADGYPTPNITWTKVSDNSPVSFPLTITGKENEGLYRCTADNGIGSTVTEDVTITVHFPTSIEPLKNKTDVKNGGNVTLYCNVSGTPTPHVSWTHVSTDKKWFSKTWVILNVKVGDLGKYKCEASNPYGNATETTFIFFPGGLCAERCSGGKSCRQFGQYLCLCEKGKTGRNCEEQGMLSKFFSSYGVFIEFKCSQN
ncbi:neurotrimin-like [Orbicella faveolata]|uniref:neurotrimin-like n=1 Tax=Orbicella faveolata TaxID=48498 RepID=UPI0009E47597|nr:neurotrimin-like [Orbicella faveolata]